MKSLVGLDASRLLSFPMTKRARITPPVYDSAAKLELEKTDIRDHIQIMQDHHFASLVKFLIRKGGDSYIDDKKDNSGKTNYICEVVDTSREIILRI